MALQLRPIALAGCLALGLSAPAHADGGGVTISSYGHSALLIQGGGATVLVNPFKAVGCAAGLAEPRVSANVILASSRLLDEGAPVASGPKFHTLMTFDGVAAPPCTVALTAALPGCSEALTAPASKVNAALLAKVSTKLASGWTLPLSSSACITSAEVGNPSEDPRDSARRDNSASISVLSMPPS